MLKTIMNAKNKLISETTDVVLVMMLSFLIKHSCFLTHIIMNDKELDCSEQSYEC